MSFASRLRQAREQLNEEGQDKVIGYVEDLNRTGYYKKDSTPCVAAKEA